MNYLIIIGLIINCALIVIRRFCKPIPDIIYLPCLIAGILCMLAGLILMKP